MKALAGIDGCRAGWVVARADTNLDGLGFEIASDISAAFNVLGSSTYVAIDIPIGLPDADPRACDVAARAILRPRNGSRVFPTPCRAALQGANYAECCRLNEQACGKAISRQAYGILSKIREVDRAMTPTLQTTVREAHPEVTFKLLRGQPLEHSKKTAAGRRERIAILDAEGLGFDAAFERLRMGRSRLAIDDLLDAAACLLTAKRIAAGQVQVIGNGALDSKGLRMEIVA